MKLMLNIVWKDARRLRWQLALMGLIMAGKFGLGVWLALGSGLDDSGWSKLPPLIAGLVGAETLVVGLIAAGLVLEDGLAGTREFWRTRPITGRRLLAAKLTGAVVLLGVPALAFSLPWWVMNGFGAGEIIAAAVAALLWRLAVVAPAFFVASLVDSTGRFVMWSLVGFAGLCTQPLAWGWLLTKGGVEASGRGAIFLGAVVATAAVVTVAEVVTWRFRCGFSRVTRGVAAAVLIAGVAGVCNLIVEKSGEFGRPGWSEAKAEIGRDVKLTWQSAQQRELKRSEPGVAVTSRLSFEGVPEGMEFEIGLVDHAWTWPGNVRTEGDMLGGGVSWNRMAVRTLLRVAPEKPDAETQRWREEREKGRTEKSAKSGSRGRMAPGTATVTARVAPSIAARIKSEPPAYQMTATLGLLKPVRWIETPLRADGWRTGEGGGLRIMAMTEGALRTVARVVESRAVWSEDFLAQLTGRRWRGLQYFAVNRAGGVLVGATGDTSASVLIGGVELQARTLPAYAPTVIRGGEWVAADPRWLEKMSLVGVRWEEMARINRTVRVEKFVIGD